MSTNGVGAIIRPFGNMYGVKPGGRRKNKTDASNETKRNSLYNFVCIFAKLSG